jgi:hypothetical protein
MIAVGSTAVRSEPGSGLRRPSSTTTGVTEFRSSVGVADQLLDGRSGRHRSRSSRPRRRPKLPVIRPGPSRRAGMRHSIPIYSMMVYFTSMSRTASCVHLTGVPPPRWESTMRGVRGPQGAGDPCSPQIRGGLAGHRHRGKDEEARWAREADPDSSVDGLTSPPDIVVKRLTSRVGLVATASPGDVAQPETEQLRT